MSLDQAMIEVTTRSETGKGPARRLRARGLIPAILYGANKEPQALTVNPEELRKALRTDHGLNTVLTLKFNQGEQTRTALLKEWDAEIISKRLLHADFLEIDVEKPIRVNVPIRVVGKCKGVTDGGLLDVTRHELMVECLPNNLPAHIDVDVTELELGDAIHAQDLKLPTGVKTATTMNYSINVMQK